mgnify:CR=1 FL=1
MRRQSDDAKASESWRIFQAFLASLPPSESARLPDWKCWRYLTGNSEPDFIWPEGKIAVELTGWIDEDQIREGKSLEEFNRKIRGLLFKERETFKTLEGHWVYLETLQRPKRKWDSMIPQMLIFFADRAATLRDLRLHLENSELPQGIRAMFRGATIYKMLGKGPSVRALKSAVSLPEQSFDAEKVIEQDLMRSFESLKRNLTKKMGKAEKYRSIGTALGFAEMWLVIYYDDTALEWAAPLLVPELQFGYGSDAHESQKKLAQRVRSEVSGDLQRGYFDRVYLLFPDQPAPFAERLSP